MIAKLFQLILIIISFILAILLDFLILKRINRKKINKRYLIGIGSGLYLSLLSFFWILIISIFSNSTNIERMLLLSIILLPIGFIIVQILLPISEYINKKINEIQIKDR